MGGEIGYFALQLIPFTILFGMGSYILGLTRKNKRWLMSGKRSVLSLVFLTTVASINLIYLLVTDNFRYQYVIDYSSTDLALMYKIAAFWGGNAGSMLLWVWILSIYTAIVTYSRHKDSEKMLPYVSTVLLGVSLFFSVVLLFVAPPFELSEQMVTEGNGLNPLLQNPGMAVHPVTLYLGYIGFSIPFAYAISALWLKKTDAVWLKVTRKWTLISWLFLSMGILYGAKWSYVELGWGGYWAWDPVENASFMPWLLATGFLHSAMIQEKKGMLKKWNVSLVVLTFLFTILGTLLTRSGILWSVHAFANGPIGAYFLGFLGITLVASMALIIYRWPDLKSDHQFEAAVSKESSFLVNNLILLGICFTVFWGTLYPVISEIITGDKVMVGAPFFNRVSLPLFIILIILMGICPLIAWRKSTLKNLKRNFLIPFLFAAGSGALLVAVGIRNGLALASLVSAIFVMGTILLEFYRGVEARKRMTGEGAVVSFVKLIAKNRRRYGGYTVHLAVVIIIIGIAVSGTYDREIQTMLKSGEQARIGAYELTFQELVEEQGERRSTVYADILVQKNNEAIGVVRPEKVFFSNGLQPATEVSIFSSWTDDLYVVLAGWDEISGGAVLQINVNPLVSWIWFGGYLLIAGTLFSLWPDRRRDTVL